MTSQVHADVEDRSTLRDRLPSLQRGRFAWWEVAVSVASVAAASVAVWLTAQAHFLAHPGWLALQKADVIVGPVAVGLYWRRRRPASRFGPFLIAFGFVGVPYILQSSAHSALFSVGVLWEAPIYLATLALILAFPSGSLAGGTERLLLAAATVGVVAPRIAYLLVSPSISGEGSISGCRASCPANALLVSAQPATLKTILDADRAAIVAVALVAAGVLLWRFATGTPPRKRAFAIGAPVALVFLLSQAAYQSILLAPGAVPQLHTFIRWTFVGTRAGIWYGFLFALIAAQLFAGRVLRRVVNASAQHPSLGDLETILRDPLGDPALRLGFWQPLTRRWVDATDVEVEPPLPASGRTLTEVTRDGRPAAAIVHDTQLADDPELLQAAGASALLALENAELEAAWKNSHDELRRSRARIAAANDVARHRIEQDLHDGAQQRLLALRVQLVLMIDNMDVPDDVRRRLAGLRLGLDETIDELRDLAHGIYPQLLADHGLLEALRSVAMRAAGTVEVTGRVDRYAIEIESAVYYCCLEALQNATKHARPSTSVSIALSESHDRLWFEVEDDGPGFDAAAVHENTGLDNMQDRVGAFDGHVEIGSTPGHGTRVAGVIPLRRADD